MPAENPGAVSDPKDPLLVEMNGGETFKNDKGKVVLYPIKDHPLEQGPSLNDALEVGSPAARIQARQPVLTRAQATDKTHSKAAGGNGYLVTVEGDYVAKNPTGTGKIHKAYKLQFKIPQLVNMRGEGALGIILGMSRETSLMKAALARLDPPGIGVRTHTITSIEPLSASTPPPTNIQYMNLDALRKLVRELELPLDPDRYWDVSHLREDIVELRTNTGEDIIDSKTREVVRKGGATLALERINARMAERQEQRELALMNQEIVPEQSRTLQGFE